MKEMERGYGVSSNVNEDDKAKTGLEGTTLQLPINRHANLKSASSDDDFRDLLLHIKSSKTPVSTSLYYQFFLCRFFLPSF